MSRVLAPQIISGGNIYFGGSNVSTATSQTKADTFYVLDPDLSTVTLNEIPNTVTPFITEYATLVGTQIGGQYLYIIDGVNTASGTINRIDTAVPQIESLVVTGDSLLSGINGVAAGSYISGGQFITFGGLKNGEMISNISAFAGTTWTTGTPPWSMNVVSTIYSDCPYVGSTSPGDIPLITNGVRFNSETTPMVSIRDSKDDYYNLNINLKRSNVYTALPGGLSTYENKGVFASWELTTSSNSIISNIGWDGKLDYNYSQNTYPNAGPAWPGDATNSSTATANFYASNVFFNSTTTAGNDTMSFTSYNTGAIPPVDPRANIVPSNVESTDVLYSNNPDMSNFFEYEVNGSVSYTDSGDANVTITNNFNPFVQDAFTAYPTVTAVYDTDNTPTLMWSLECGLSDAIEPPGNMPPGNAMVADVYRQYVPTQLTRSGRLDKVSSFYGQSRYTIPGAVAQQEGTLDYGVYRDSKCNNDVRQRKLTLVSFCPEGKENIEGKYVEVYKYFASNTASYPTPDPTVSKRGWYDEIFLSFGECTTASGNKETISIMPGYGTDPVATGLTPTDATTADDTIEVLFSDYNTKTQSVTANVIYSSAVVQRVVSSAQTINLSSDVFNMLSDPFGRSGNVVITSTHNSGIISSNIDFGVRPYWNEVADPSGVAFSQDLFTTCLSAWSNVTLPYGNAAQSNVFETVLPVNVSMQQYNPTGIYTDQLGRAILKRASISIAGQEIQSFDDLWYVSQDQLFKTDDEKRALKYMINGGEDYLPTSPLNYGPVDLYIPLEFFFCRDRKNSAISDTPKRAYDEYRSYNPYLPLCAMTDQELMVTLEFYPQTYFSNTTSTIDLSYENTSIITEEIQISKEERLYFQNTPLEILIANSTTLPKQLMSMTEPTVPQRFEGLVADFPVKLLTWLLRSKQFEDETNSTEFLNRYNFSTIVSDNEDYKLYFQFTDKVDFFLEGVPQVERFGTSDFFRYLQTLNSGITSTNKNIYSYTFAMYPNKATPSGSLNLSESNSNKTFLALKIAPRDSSAAIESVDKSLGATMHAYAYGYNVLKIADNITFKVFS